MREPPDGCSELGSFYGITPAHAGTTSRVLKQPRVLVDHPRSCGNHMSCALSSRNFLGSPPLMREPHQPFKFAKVCTGITPAHAGTTIIIANERDDG